ncbi:MAG: hypothetical protein QOF31_5704 [Mycobacterium sp.]|jgi:hypothetical protein|nr:hypothetical protein [Mycobacterium sp.]
MANERSDNSQQRAADENGEQGGDCRTSTARPMILGANRSSSAHRNAPENAAVAMHAWTDVT